ncbi:hypothetical protein SLS62_004845 [Diatrype stigma]|uniref:Uncharacterized protein n=1 Tax=Diatrype stigma TaxID=117547 RepID=A0AAN9UPY6_9PEZI
MGLVDAPNKVPEHQRFYQHQYKQHVRLWKIVRAHDVPRPTLYMMGRKAAGYNTWFGKN